LRLGPSFKLKCTHAAFCWLRVGDRNLMHAEPIVVVTSTGGKNVLVLDVGGTHIKMLATGQPQPQKFTSGKSMTPRKMVKKVEQTTAGWKYECISMGYPGPVLHGRPVCEPYNLGDGWVGFDFKRAFGRPIKIINDAAMQALGSYQGGRMLFLGLGTGLGSAMIVDGRIEPLELAHLPYKKDRTYEDYVGARGLKRGVRKWRKAVADVVDKLQQALEVDELVIGGGNAKLLKSLPPKTRLVDNSMAFVGGFRLWEPGTDDTHINTEDLHKVKRHSAPDQRHE
jgi:predicted NBD/HSP70 family sugar kinase